MAGWKGNLQTLQPDWHDVQSEHLNYAKRLHFSSEKYLLSLFLKPLFVITRSARKVCSYICFMLHTALNGICRHSTNGHAIHHPTLTNAAWQKKAWTCFYYVAQLAPNPRGLCSFSSVPESRTAAHESPFCGESSLGSVTERWNGSRVTSKNKIMQRVTCSLRHTSFPALFFLASHQPVLRLTGWIKSVRHVLVIWWEI